MKTVMRDGALTWRCDGPDCGGEYAWSVNDNELEIHTGGTTLSEAHAMSMARAVRDAVLKIRGAMAAAQ